MTQTVVPSSDQGGRASVSLIGSPRPSGAGVTAPLVLPVGHPFFFDHPLDHVSGMLTICGMLDLADTLGAGPTDDGHRLLLDLDFLSMADAEDGVVLAAAPDRTVPGRFFVRAEQVGTVRTEGSLRRIEGVAPAAPAGRPPVRSSRPRCASELVNRARKDNVLLSASERDGAEFVMRVLRPPAGHYLLRFGADGYSERGMIEASRQFITALIHEVAGKPLGNRIIWREFAADIPSGPTGSGGYLLRWRPQPLRGSRITLDMELVDEDSLAVVGHFHYRVVVVGPAAYQRFRGATRSGAMR